MPNLLTPAQERYLRFIDRAHWATQGYLSTKPFWAGDQRIPLHIVQKLLDLGLIQRETVDPGGYFPDGSRNLSHTVIYIICLSAKGRRFLLENPS